MELNFCIKDVLSVGVDIMSDFDIHNLVFWRIGPMSHLMQAWENLKINLSLENLNKCEKFI